MRSFLHRTLAIGVLPMLLGGGVALAQDNAVVVTIEAASTELIQGQKTTLTVYAQISAALEADSQQIFSWYVDVLNTDGLVASGYNSFSTPASDNHIQTSGDGVEVGGDLLGVYDTFIMNPGAGKGARVVLMQFDVTALSAGSTTFSVAPGSTGLPLQDFLVSRSSGGGYLGGVYGSASVTLNVQALDPASLNLVATRVNDEVTATFNPVPGLNHYLEYSDTLQPGSWTVVPGAPHNSGIVTQAVPGVVRRFYRVGLATP